MKVRNKRDMEVYDELTEFRGSPPPGHLFDLAIEKRAVGNYLDEEDEMELDDLSGFIDDLGDTLQKSREIRFEARNSSSDEASQRGPADHRLDAAQRIIALEIAADEAVASFRADNLDEALIGVDEVAAWVERTADTDEKATLWIEMPKKALDTIVSSDSQASLDPPPGYSERFDDLRYNSGGLRHASSVAVRFGGVLDDLRVLSKRVSRWYEWDEAAAATFILTGLRPAPRGANARRVEPWPWPIPRRRIELDIPLSTAPKEVESLYQRLRDEMLIGGPRPRRSLGERSADLAVFAAEHASGYTWEEARTIWNRRHQKRSSHLAPDPAQFIRDSRSAYKRVTGEKLTWDRKQPRRTPHTNQPKET